MYLYKPKAGVLICGDISTDYLIESNWENNQPIANGELQQGFKVTQLLPLVIYLCITVCLTISLYRSFQASFALAYKIQTTKIITGLNKEKESIL
jgi:hypothetical protein